MIRLPIAALGATLIATWPCCAAPQGAGMTKPGFGEWTAVVVQHLDTLLEHGTDTYGPVHSPLLMAVIDVRTLESPEHPEDYGSLVRLEDRIHRRGERGSNLWYDQTTLRALYRVGELTGDARYGEAADAYVAYAFDHCRKPNGLLAWGTHIHWDCYQDRAGGDQDGAGPHEILVYLAEWLEMYRVRPEAVRQEVDLIWRWHVVDEESGLHNRHDDDRAGCDFAFSGGSFAVAFGAMYQATGEERYLDHARRVAGWHWQHRHPQTGLVPDAPCTGGRYDSTHCFTNEPGLFAAMLLRTYELTGEEDFRDMAVAYIKSYDRYGWDEAAQTYHAMLELDGTPVPARPKGAGYDAWAPTGHVNVWRTSIFSYEFTLSAAQAAVYAYELSDSDPELLAIAERWASVIEGALPPDTGRRWRAELEAAMPGVVETGGVYAEDYGRSISFFVHMARATGAEHYLDLAQGLATEAVTKLFENGLLKGHPAKPYYEVTDGVGLLLVALLELDAPQEQLPAAF